MGNMNRKDNGGRVRKKRDSVILLKKALSCITWTASTKGSTKV